MANDQNATQARRQFHHRGRRGPDRRREERHTAPQTTPEAGSRESVDVEQIMREIRSRIPTRHGIELTRAQVQELAARRLDAILEPRHVKPELMEQLRRAAGEPIAVPATPVPDPAPPLDEAALYSSHRAGLGRVRRWLAPILKLFFNPAPIIESINAERTRGAAAAARERELHVRQAQWNALHYEILQRLVLEVSRASIEAQQLSMQVEALSAKLDFNERRLRSIEQAAHTGRPASRVAEPRASEPASNPEAPASPTPGTPADASAEGSRRRRRRRRGRRSGLSMVEGGAMPSDADRLDAEDGDLEAEDNGDADRDADAPTIPAAAPDQEAAGAITRSGTAAPGSDSEAALELPHTMSLVQPVERHPDPGRAEPRFDPQNEEAAAPRGADNPPAGAGAAPAGPDPDEREPPDR